MAIENYKLRKALYHVLQNPDAQAPPDLQALLDENKSSSVQQQPPGKEEETLGKIDDLVGQLNGLLGALESRPSDQPPVKTKKAKKK